MARPMPFVSRAAAALLLLAASVASNAATVTFNNVANSVNRGGVFTGLYSLTIDTETILAMCDSRNSLVNPPVTWTADIRSFAEIQAGNIGKFIDNTTPATLAASIVKYSQAGWLFSQLATPAPNDYSGQADINEAIWKVMTPSYALVGSGASAWYTAATGGAYDSFDWTNVMRVVTANPLVQGGIDVQEFLVGPVVPVPAAVWLFGSSLGLLGLARRRRSAG